MEFSHYDYVPNELAEKVIATHKAAHGEQFGRRRRPRESFGTSHTDGIRYVRPFLPVCQFGRLFLFAHKAHTLCMKNQ